MSSKSGKFLALSGIDYSGKTEKEIRELFYEVLNDGMHGLGFSAYEEGQEPGDTLSEAQIRRRMEIIAPYTKWVRSFSCIEGNEIIPKVAHEFGIKAMAGAWLGDDKEKNDEEIASLIQMGKEGLVDIAAVGNEVLLRNDLTLDELLDQIAKVKEALPGVPVGYVDAYYEFVTHPQLIDACDVLLINCYPFWEGCHLDYSFPYMQNMYYQVQRVAKGKPIIVSETGWPSQGTSYKDSHPSAINFMKYFINAQLWSKKDDIDMMYFTSFDESWKVGAEGDVGAYWGIWDKDEQLKF